MTEPSAQVVPPPTGTVFISDDDDDLDETLDEWVDGVDAADQHPYLIHAAHIQHQLNLCYGLLCVLPVLIALVILAWRRYGGIISAAKAKDSEGASRSRSSSAADKKNT